MKYVFILISFLIPFISNAEEGGGPAEPYTRGSGLTLDNPLKAESIQQLLQLIVDIIIQIGMPVLVLVFVFIGFKFVTARGNPDAINSAKRWFGWAVVGSAVVLGAFVIATAIEGTISQITN